MKELSPIVFGTSCFGNLYKSIPFETKVEIAAEWFKAFPKPFIDSAGKYGAGLSLECIGKALRALGKKNGDLTISVKLGWRRSRRLNPWPGPSFGGPGAPRECAYAHYSRVKGADREQLAWLRRAIEHENAANGGFETWGASPNWYYEWPGWGTLTKRR